MKQTNKKFNFMVYFPDNVDPDNGEIEALGFDDPKEPVEWHLGPVEEYPDFYEFFESLTHLKYGETIIFPMEGIIYTRID